MKAPVVNVFGQALGGKLLLGPVQANNVDVTFAFNKVSFDENTPPVLLKKTSARSMLCTRRVLRLTH